MDQSTASRHRSAFNFGNAECEWVAMTTLTWQEMPPQRLVKAALRRFREKLIADYECSLDAWIMEIQERGVPHYHLFWAAQSIAGQTIAAMPTQTFQRKGRDRRIVRGSFDKWIVEKWMECSEQLNSADAWAFNEGGITELFDSPDAAGRYVAKESSKRAQKVLPDAYAEGLGRWYWLNPRYKPRPRARGKVVAWPLEGPMKHVWQKDTLAGHTAPDDDPPAPASSVDEILKAIRRKTRKGDAEK